jgi:3-hydroxyisobutyrate dehydrogenase
MTTTTRCYVVGLGNIGAAIATRLATTEADVVGIDLAAEARAAFETATGRTALGSWSEVTLRRDDRVVLLVRTAEQAGEALREVRRSGVAVTVFVMTTLDMEAATVLGDPDDSTVRVVELPVSGGRSGALDGTLTMMAAGPLTTADRTFLLTHLASRLVMFDHYGQPTAAKLHNNALAAYTARAHAEILLAGVRNGLDITLLDEVLNSSSGASWMGANLAVIVDDLLEKDVGLFEDSFGPLVPLDVGTGSGLAAALAAAREQLGTPASVPPERR